MKPTTESWPKVIVAYLMFAALIFAYGIVAALNQ